MKKQFRIMALLLAALMLVVGCSNTSSNDSGGSEGAAETSQDTGNNESSSGNEESSNESSGDKHVVRLAMIPSSGHVFDAIARDKGIYDEEGIEVEIQYINNGVEAFQAIAANKCDVGSTFGTGTPVQMICSGSDLAIIGGYMLEGAMPVIAQPGSGFNDVEDFVGKKIAMLHSNYQITGPLIDLGYDVQEDIEVVEILNQMDKIEAVKSGEVDYALMATGIGYTAEQAGLEEVTFSSDLLPEYSCCRVVVGNTWAKENPEAVHGLLKSWIRAQQIFEQDRSYAVDLLDEQLDVPREQIEHYVMDEEHFELQIDPGKKIVSRAYYYLDNMGMIENSGDVSVLEERIDVDSYKKALDEVIEEHYDEDPEFYDRQLVYYEENDTKSIAEYLEEYGYTEYVEEKGLK